MAKVRLGFVSNSSSSSFVCNVCSNSEVGYDESPEGWVSCVNGHTLCDGCVDGNPDTDDCGEIAEKDCSICQFVEIEYGDMARYLEKNYKISRDEVFAEIKKINKRRKKLYDTEYVEYVCRQHSLVVQNVLTEIREKFNSYIEYRDYLRRS